MVVSHHVLQVYPVVLWHGCTVQCGGLDALNCEENEPQNLRVEVCAVPQSLLLG